MENVKLNYPYVAVATSKRVKMPLGWAVYISTRDKVYTFVRPRDPRLIVESLQTSLKPWQTFVSGMASTYLLMDGQTRRV